MIRLLVAALGVASILSLSNGYAEIKRWRIGDDVHPWTLRPVTGRLDLGRSWAVELIADDDGDGRIDEDPVGLITYFGRFAILLYSILVNISR